MLKRFLAVLFIPFLIHADPGTMPSEIRSFLKKNRKINTESMTVESIERWEGEFKEKKVDLIISREPLKIYYRRHYPREGLELVYDREKGGDVKVHTNGWPNLKLKLDPYEGLIRKNTRHIIEEAGLDYIARILSTMLNNKDRQLQITQLPDSSYKGRAVSRFLIRDPNFHLYEYRCEKKMTTGRIASKFMINEYSILEYNDNIDEYGAIPENTLLMLPSGYAEEFELYLDNKVYLPVLVRAKDNKGLMEQFVMTHHKIDIPVSEKTFQLD